MDMTSFWSEIEARIAKYDLLKHPFYTAWSNGELTRDDLKMYAIQYYPHVEAFPEYLSEFAERLPQNETRFAIEENKAEELGAQSTDGKSHSDMWVDFAEGMGASAADIKDCQSIPEIKELMSHFYDVARKGQPVEALAAFYAYESQVPRIAAEKAKGLATIYGANARTRRYFSVHRTADIEHAEDWRGLIDKEVSGDEGKMRLAVDSAEAVASRLWKVLDGIETVRTGKAPAMHAAC